MYNCRVHFQSALPVVEMNLSWKQTSSQLFICEFADIFEKAFLPQHGKLFFATTKSSTHRQNLINFGGYFIYSGYLINRRRKTLDTTQAHAHQTVWERSKQPLNWMKLTQVGKIRSYFVGLKFYFSISELIQNLFKSE